MGKMTENGTLVFWVTEQWADLHSLYQHFLPLECHPVLPYPLLRNSFRPQHSGIVLFLYLLQRGRGRIFQALFLSRLEYLKLQDNRLVVFFRRLQHHIISAEPAFPV